MVKSEERKQKKITDKKRLKKKEKKTQKRLQQIKSNLEHIQNNTIEYQSDLKNYMHNAYGISCSINPLMILPRSEVTTSMNNSRFL